jgi:hypothetical protein
VLAVEAIAPSAPCRIKLIISEEQKPVVYVRGRNLDKFGAYSMMILERQIYMPAEMNAGAMVRKMR